jgi:hypothetical protein
MLTVIGAGLPRTGTSSLKVALERLGFGPCYHMTEIHEHPDQVDRWLTAASDVPADWDRVFDGYRSSQDWPAAHFWRELAEAYPEAKVILTVRDPHRWYRSFRLMTERPRPDPQEKRPDAIPPVFVAMDRLRPLLDRIGQSIFGPEWRFGADMPNEQPVVEAFQRHAATVREGLPEDRLLVFDVGQGWQPLCEFLGVKAPDGEPFPHVNDAESMRRRWERSKAERRFISPFEPSL